MVDTQAREALLEPYGRYYGEQKFAVAFTASQTGDDAKRVTQRGWDKTAPLADGNFGAALVNGRGKQRNVAIVVRASNLVVIECDSEEDLARIQDLNLPETLTVRSSQPYKRHYYFRPDPAMEMLPYVAFRFESGKITADTGRYFLAPPSIHPTGAIYAFLPDHGPDEIQIATLPETTYRAISDAARAETGALRDSIQFDPETKIKAGNRRDLIFRYACMLRRWGIPEPSILEQCHLFNETRCEPPVDRSLVAVQVTGAMKMKGNQELERPDITDDEQAIRIVPLEDFINVTEDVATPLIGQPGDSLLPSEGLLFMYGDGGAGKTTLAIDAVAHLASGTPWLDNFVSRPIRVLLIENEGPRGPFRETMKAKVDTWNGSPFAELTHVLEEPWTRFTLDDDRYREAVAQEISQLGIDLIVVGPLASLGAKGAGTPDDVNAFALMISDLRARTEQPFGLWIVHHENKQGDVSGAWERLPDTLVHVSAQGNGRTRVHWRKVRWSSRTHNTSIALLWDNGGFILEEARIRDLAIEIAELFQNQDEWRTAKEVSKTLGANLDKIRDDLHQLTIEGRLMFAQGPPGRHASSKCWRLRLGDSALPSHPESPALFPHPGAEVTRVTRPYNESPKSQVGSETKKGDSTPPSHLPLKGPDDDIPF